MMNDEELKRMRINGYMKALNELWDEIRSARKSIYIRERVCVVLFLFLVLQIIYMSLSRLFS